MRLAHHTSIRQFALPSCLPQFVTFNGSSWDLLVLRYRATVYRVAAPGLWTGPQLQAQAGEAAYDSSDRMVAQGAIRCARTGTTGTG